MFKPAYFTKQYGIAKAPPFVFSQTMYPKKNFLRKTFLDHNHRPKTAIIFRAPSVTSPRRALARVSGRMESTTAGFSTKYRSAAYISFSVGEISSPLIMFSM
jgi:hypothetical protein